MTDPAEFDPKETPSITLGGKQWPIPKLVPRQLRKCRASLIELNDRLNAAAREAESASPAVDDLTRNLLNVAALGRVFNALSDEDLDRLVYNVIHAALTRAHPSLAKEEFLDYSFADGDMMTAWLVVREQSGVFVFRDRGASQSGETQGPSQPRNPIGTE